MKKAKSTRAKTATRQEYSMCTMVHMNSQAKPVEYTNIVNAYTKDNMYCIYTQDGMVHKYPTCNIFRIVETY
jgi:hypothetical protein